jgi:hypothetical protein
METALIVTAASGKNAVQENAEPVRRWQSRQVQACTRCGAKVTVAVSAPHRQAAVFG